MEELALREQAKKSRRLILRMITQAGNGHPGGSLSAVEILTALFFHEMHLNPNDPQWPERDRFVLSKGHAAPTLYATLAYRGYFDPTETLSLRKLEGAFQGHPDRVRLPEVEASTGSLGQGLSVAQGLAMAARMDGVRSRVYALIGDGESQEGQIWEAALSCGFYKLSNLCVFFDGNQYQIDGRVQEVLDLHPLKAKWEAFGWHVVEIDGHSFSEILAALKQAHAHKEKPTMVLARTVKGKGVSFVEGDNKWHGVALNPKELERALEELQ